MIEPLEDRMLLSAPNLNVIDSVTVAAGSPMIVGIDGIDDGDFLSYNLSVTDQDGNAVSQNDIVVQMLGDSDDDGVSENSLLILETNKGTMVFELFDDLVPELTAYIKNVVNDGFYNGLTFHRVIEDLMAQAGSRYYDADGVVINEDQANEDVVNYFTRSHDYDTVDDYFRYDLQHNAPGLLSMAKPPGDDSATTQFFITDAVGDGESSSPIIRQWDYNHSIFGKLLEGWDVFEQIMGATTGPDGDLEDAPVDPIIIQSASVEDSDHTNATFTVFISNQLAEGTQYNINITATDSENLTVDHTVTMTVGVEDDSEETVLTENSSGQVTAYEPNYYNANPYLDNIDEIIVPWGQNEIDIIGSAIDIDGVKTFLFADGQTADELVYLSVINSEVSGYVLASLIPSGSSLTDFDLPDGLSFVLVDTLNGPTRIQVTGGTPSTGNFTFLIELARTDANFVGHVQVMLARYNQVQSTYSDIPRLSGTGTSFDTEIVDLIFQPPTPASISLNPGTSNNINDNTPSVTVTGLRTDLGLGLRILANDENGNDIVVGEVQSITDATTTLEINALPDGAHTLRAVQYVVDDVTGVEAVSEAATSSEFTVDTEAPQAFTDVALTAATSGVLYTYDVGHPQEDDNSITYSLSGAPAGMTIDQYSALITWDTPTDSNYPSVTFDIIATDAAGNTTTAEDVTITVNSFVDLSGVVFNDINDNGNADAGEGMEGVHVFADINGNNILDETDIVDTTSASGSYSLPNVPAGTVVLHQTLADGYEQQSPDTTRLTMVQIITDGDDATVNNQPTTVDGLTWAGALAMSSDGLSVYATSGISAANSDDGIAVFSRNPDDGTLRFVQFVDGIAELNDPNAITISPDGRHVYVTCDNAGSDGIIIFSRDQGTGELAQVGFIVDGGTDAAGNTVDNIGGTVKVVVSADNEFVYVASRYDDAITVFERDRNTGNLTWVQELVDAVNLNGASQLTLSPNGDFLYVGLFEGIAVYSINATTGQLTHLEDVDADSLSEMREMAITPDGKYLYAASNIDGKLNIFSRNTTTGELTFLSATNTYGTPSGLTISPDGSKLYMAAIFADQLHVFDIQSDGSLVINQTLEQDVADDLAQTVAGLDGAVTLLLDPDGHDVYVASRVGAGNISVFSDRTRAWTGIPYVREVTPTSNNHTGINFANTTVTVDVADVQYNTLNYDADKPTDQDYNAPTSWSQQRSTINDITITLNRDLIEVDKSAITLTRIFDVDGSVISETVTLAVNDITVVGDTLIISNLDLVDGVYEVVISTDFNAAMDSEYSTYFHQLLGDLNGDRLFNAVDLASMVYWQQLAADTDNYGFVPGYLDINNTLDQSTPDGRVDTHDFSEFVSYFGNFIPQDAVPIPDIILSSIDSQPPVMAAMLAYTAPKSASLQLVWSDDDEEGSGNTLLDQLDDPNMVLEMIDSE